MSVQYANGCSVAMYVGVEREQQLTEVFRLAYSLMPKRVICVLQAL